MSCRRSRALGLDPKRVVYLPHAVDTDRLFAFADATRVAPPDVADVLLADAPGLGRSRPELVEGQRPAPARGRSRRGATTFGSSSANGAATSTRAAHSRANSASPTGSSGCRRSASTTSGRGTSRATRSSTSSRCPRSAGVAFEAMALGRRVITALDPTQTERFFGAAPPLLAAQDVDAVAARSRASSTDPDDRAGLGAASRAGSPSATRPTASSICRRRVPYAARRVRESLLDILVDPVSGAPLSSRQRRSRGGEVVDGTLAADGSSYPITSGIPRFVAH